MKIALRKCNIKKKNTEEISRVLQSKGPFPKTVG